MADAGTGTKPLNAFSSARDCIRTRPVLLCSKNAPHALLHAIAELCFPVKMVSIFTGNEEGRERDIAAAHGRVFEPRVCEKTQAYTRAKDTDGVMIQEGLDTEMISLRPAHFIGIYRRRSEASEAIRHLSSLHFYHNVVSARIENGDLCILNGATYVVMASSYYRLDPKASIEDYEPVPAAPISSFDLPSMPTVGSSSALGVPLISVSEIEKEKAGGDRLAVGSSKFLISDGTSYFKPPNAFVRELLGYTALHSETVPYREATSLPLPVLRWAVQLGLATINDSKYVLGRVDEEGV